MKIRTQKILAIFVLVLVCTDLIYIYLKTNSFNALYAGSILILFGLMWDALKRVEKSRTGTTGPT